jgi:hypothetical protein
MYFPESSPEFEPIAWVLACLVGLGLLVKTGLGGKRWSPNSGEPASTGERLFAIFFGIAAFCAVAYRYWVK